MLDRVRLFLTGRGLVFVPWLLLATGNLFADALHDRDATFRTSVSVGLWLVWAAVLVISVMPGSGALTVVRTIVPAAVPATLWAYEATGNHSDLRHLSVIALAAVATLGGLSSRVGERFVDAASYGDERRFLLRPSALVQVGLLLPTWAVAVTGLAAGPLALADGRWVLGPTMVVTGIPLALLALRAMVRVAQRWLVFVPAGLVVHDHVAVSEPFLVRSSSIDLLGPARSGSSAADLTAGAAGLALEIQLGTPIEIPVATGRRSTGQTAVTRFLVTPSRPAAVMSEASRRRIPIG